MYATESHDIPLSISGHDPSVWGSSQWSSLDFKLNNIAVDLPYGGVQSRGKRIFNGDENFLD